MKIDVAHVAKLSRLRIPPEQLNQFEQQMQEIVNMVEDLPQPTVDNLSLRESDAMELRPDEVKPSLHRELLLAGAPKKQAGCVVVPKTL